LCSVDLVKYFVLYDLYVTERLRRQGVARSLMNTASEWARAQGAARLDLETARDNAAGQALYRSLGYELDEVFLKFSLNLGQ
jgi:ribosomal protein S18 acetylase RimI-like enzyme